MKYIYSLFLIFFSFQIVAQNGLVSHLPFTSCNLTEATGVNPSVFPVGFDVSTMVCACGVRDSAIVLDGDDDKIILSGNYDNYFDNSDFTISINFISDNQSGNRAIYSMRDSCSATRGLFLKYAAATNTITAFVGENDLKKVTLFGQLETTRCWHHIVLVRKDNKVSLFANGVLLDSGSTTSVINCKVDNTTFQIGTDPCVGTTDFNFAGKIDDFRVYQVALNVDEIRDLNFPVDRIGNKSDTLIVQGSSVDIYTVAGTTCATDFKWTPVDPFWGVDDLFDPNTTITPPETQTYKLSFTHETGPQGCVLSSDTIRIVVVDPDSLDCDEIFLPKAFTPNDDGLNDTYGINNPFAIVNFISFEILDRWGGKVFYSEDPFMQWDGSFNGSKVNPGVCVYRIRYICKGEEKILLGSFTVLR